MVAGVNSTDSAPAVPGLHVVKVGGSLFQPSLLGPMLDWLEARQRETPLLVVCGGGRYADVVRAEQQRLGWSDLTAHRQALLSMEQGAWALQAAWQQRHQRLLPVRSDLLAGTLWTPRALLPDHPEVAADWQMTSDSLAAWAARTAGAQTLTLLKSLDQPALQADVLGSVLQDWVRQGWVDARFRQEADCGRMVVRLLGQRAWCCAAAQVAGRTAAATAQT